MLRGGQRESTHETGNSQDSDTFVGRQAYERQSLLFQVRDEVEKAMTKQGVTQAQLAKEMGVSEGRVSQILAGDQNLTVKTLAALSASLGLHFQLTLVTASPLVNQTQETAADPQYAGH